MSTPNGPVCDCCRQPLPFGSGYVQFFFTHEIFCSLSCLDATEQARSRQWRARILNIVKYGRFWRVLDGNGELVTTCVYKKGAQEVVRRLTAK